MKGLFSKFYLCIIGILCLQACTKEVSFQQKEVEKRLVVNGFIEPDSLIVVRISGTASILTDQAPLIEDASVKLSVNGKYREKLQYMYDGFYSSSIRAVPGSVYMLEVYADGYPIVSALDTLPNFVPILEGKKEIGNSFDEYGDPHLDVEFLFRDPSGTDFYEFMFLPHHSYSLEDGVYYIEFQWPLYIADPVLIKDSELEYEPFTYVFSDDLIGGREYRMQNKFIFSATSDKYKQPIIQESDLSKSYIVLRHVSKAYYQYRKSWLWHSKNQQSGHIFDDPLNVITVGSPKPMYSNIHGGYGIFAAYNTSYYKVER